MISVVAKTQLKLVDVQATLDQVDGALQQVALCVVERLVAVTGNWRHKPKFQTFGPRWSGKSRKAGTREVLVVPEEDEAGQIFTYVDQGTKPHVIKAKNVPYLKFQVPSSPKTLPSGAPMGILRAPTASMVSLLGQGGKQWVQVKEVHHPGTEPREFMAWAGSACWNMHEILMRKALHPRYVSIGDWRALRKAVAGLQS